jgi:cytochrome oxidase assembly protein ShyY1
VRSLRFLLTRRWILFAITVALLAALAWRLGVWQFHRLEERKATNAIVETNVAAAPVPVGDVLQVGTEVSATNEWKRVTATGQYDAADTVVVRYQTRDGQAGVDVVVPLRTEQGPDLLVDRGWLAGENRAADVSDVPAPPSGRVTVSGWDRVDGTGDSTHLSDHSVRSISSVAIGDALDLEVYGGFIELDTESPAPDQALTKAELPDLSNGPHFFYGLQWWFFGLLAIFGFFYLLYDEWRGPGLPKGRSQPAAQGASQGPSQGAQHASVDGEHDTVDEA